MNRQKSLALAALVFALSTLSTPSVSAELIVEDRRVEALVLPHGDLWDATPVGTTFLFVGPFHTIQRPWWPEADTWDLPSDQTSGASSAIAAATAMLPNVANDLTSLGFDADVIDDLRLYPVEALLELFECLIRDACYPKGLVIGTSALAPDIAAGVCEELEDLGRHCQLLVRR